MLRVLHLWGKLFIASGNLESFQVYIRLSFVQVKLYLADSIGLDLLRNLSCRLSVWDIIFFYKVLLL